MLDFNSYYRAIVTKQQGTGTKADMNTNRTEYPEISPIASQLFFDKGVKNIHWKKASSTNGAGKTGYLPAKDWS
jgi:hypothetical protein